MKIDELINFQYIQEMVDANYRAAGMPVGVIDAESGKIYAGTGWQRICIEYHRKHPVTKQRCIESDRAVKENIKGRSHYGYKCANGLWDIGIPIYVEGEHSANLFLGQFFYEGEQPEREFFINQAEKYNFDREDYLDALDSVPVFSRDKVDNILDYNRGLAKFIGDLATNNLRLRREVEVRRAAEEELNKAQLYIQNIFDSMPSMLVGVDCRGNITHWNMTAEKVTGHTSLEMLGKELTVAFPSLGSKIEEIIENVCSGRLLQETKRLHRISKENRYEDITVYPLKTNGVEGAVIRVDDVTERVRMEEILIQSEKMMSVGGLAAGMAHEINNPLAGILQTANVMADRLYRKQEMGANRRAAAEAGSSMEAITSYMEKRGIDRMLKSIDEAGRRLAQLVENMLSFSRKTDAGRVSCDMVELIEKTLSLASTDYDLQKQNDFKQIRIVREYADHLPAVTCDRGQIQQVLLNLLRNAAQAIHDAGVDSPTITIRLNSANHGNGIILQIEDSGPGLDAETKKRIFEPFFTTKDVGKGTGLGLSISYFIITEHHEGTMSVESYPGRGACFTITLPLGS